MCPPESLRSAFRHADVVELPFLDQASQCLDRLLYWNIIVHARALKKVQLLRSTKSRIDVVDTTTQALWR